jgi:hypothetical protein
MSGVAVIFYLLSHDAPVLAAVPAANTMAGDLPLNTALPAIGIKQISGFERLTVSMNGAKKMQTERVQVTVQTKTYPEKKALLALVRTACANRNGTVNGVDLDSILPDTEGPDLDDAATGIYTQSRDFIVKYRI